MKYDDEWIKNATFEQLEQILFTCDGQGTKTKRNVFEEICHRRMVARFNDRKPQESLDKDKE